jgi:hypothetical protein
MSKRGFGGSKWCIVGDFNSVREVNERRGVGVNVMGGVTQEITEFGEFLDALEVIDMPLIGRRFTWFHPNGTTMSRLDRVLLSNDWGEGGAILMCGLFIEMCQITVRLLSAIVCRIGVPNPSDLITFGYKIKASRSW